MSFEKLNCSRHTLFQLSPVLYSHAVRTLLLLSVVHQVNKLEICWHPTSLCFGRLSRTAVTHAASVHSNLTPATSLARHYACIWGSDLWLPAIVLTCRHGGSAHATQKPMETMFSNDWLFCWHGCGRRIEKQLNVSCKMGVSPRNTYMRPKDIH